MGEKAEKEIQVVQFNDVGIPIVDKSAREAIKTIETDMEKMGGFEPVIDEETGKMTGYKTTRGADTVFPFREAPVKVGALSGNGTINVSSRAGYKNFKNSNFIIEVTGVSGGSTGTDHGHWYNARTTAVSVSKNYNASTGVLTISGLTQTIQLYNTDTDGGVAASASQKISVNVYLVV